MFDSSALEKQTSGSFFGGKIGHDDESEGLVKDCLESLARESRTLHVPERERGVRGEERRGEERRGGGGGGGEKRREETRRRGEKGRGEKRREEKRRRDETRTKGRDRMKIREIRK